MKFATELTKRMGVMPKANLVQPTEDVLVDTRGNIYITDKQWGLFVRATPAKASPHQQRSERRDHWRSYDNGCRQRKPGNRA
jgi:hypothetical protein